MRRLIITAFVGSIALSAACARPPTVTALDKMNTQQLVNGAQYAAQKAQGVRGRHIKARKREWTTKGMAYAERCVEISPQTPGCYYWRAVNTGLYHSVKVSGYQQGIKQMLADCDMVIRLGQQGYDNAGPYRIQGEIYTRLPETAGRPDSITRDLEKAEGFLRTAISIAPDYPENHIALANNLYLQDRYDEAREELVLAKKYAPQWRIDASYPEWQKTIARLTKKIDRKTK
jgi:tetratricopeptide (TPR) repeat protein